VATDRARRFDGDEGTINSWSIEFDSAEPSVQTDGDGNYEFADVARARTRSGRSCRTATRRRSRPAGAGTSSTWPTGQQVTGRNFGNSHGAPPAQIVGRQLFYNNSALDGNNAGAGRFRRRRRRGDPQPGTRRRHATFANYSTYSRGLNGLMIDVKNLPAGYVPVASDFAFAAGNTANPATWQPVTRQPSSVTVRRGVDPDGDGDAIDRITIIWPDNAIQNQWLKVTAPAGGNLGLSDTDVFFFGHLGGDTGFPAGVASVNAIDFQRVRRAIGQSAVDANAVADFNHNGRIDATRPGDSESQPGPVAKPDDRRGAGAGVQRGAGHHGRQDAANVARVGRDDANATGVADSLCLPALSFVCHSEVLRGMTGYPLRRHTFSSQPSGSLPPRLGQDLPVRLRATSYAFFASARSASRMLPTLAFQHTSTAFKHHSALLRLARIAWPSTSTNTGLVWELGRMRSATHARASA
jgi:hypothetical protein